MDNNLKENVRLSVIALKNNKLSEKEADFINQIKKYKLYNLRRMSQAQRDFLLKISKKKTT